MSWRATGESETHRTAGGKAARIGSGIYSHVLRDEHGRCNPTVIRLGQLVGFDDVPVFGQCDAQTTMVAAMARVMMRKLRHEGRPHWPGQVQIGS